MLRQEKGITLVALVVTIIILIILAAVAIGAVYQSNMVNYAINGATNYSEASVNENKILNETADLLDSVVESISSILAENE